jgi:hypothetical protein
MPLGASGVATLTSADDGSGFHATTLVKEVLDNRK